MSNNSLIPIKESIFSKIKNFLKNLFGQETIENYELENTENIIEDKQEIKNSFLLKYKSWRNRRTKIIKLQRLIRERRISENDLSAEEKAKLSKLYNSQIENLRNSILQKRNKIMKIKYEQKRKSHATT